MSHETPFAVMACQGPFGGQGVTTFTLRPAPVEAGSSGFWGTTLTAASSLTGALRGCEADGWVATLNRTDRRLPAVQRMVRWRPSV